MAKHRIGAFDYEIGRLSTFEQLHVGRKLAPVLTWIGAMKKSSQVTDQAQFAKALASLTGTINDADMDFCLGTCLRRVTRADAAAHGAMVPVVSADGQLMFQDIELPELTAILWHSINGSGIVDFFAADLPQPTEKGKAPASNGSTSPTEKTTLPDLSMPGTSSSSR